MNESRTTINRCRAPTKPLDQLALPTGGCFPLFEPRRLSRCLSSTVFYFGIPQYDEGAEGLYDIDTDAIEEQKENLGEFLVDDVSVCIPLAKRDSVVTVVPNSSIMNSNSIMLQSLMHNYPGVLERVRGDN